MNYSIETEIKSRLSHTDFLQLLHHFQLSEHDCRTQHNTYYDTHSHQLKQHHAALRLRNVASTSEWTFKQRIDSYSSTEINEYNNKFITPPNHLLLNHIPNTDIQNILSQWLESSERLFPIVSFQTDRWSIQTEYGEYALDRMRVNSYTDYEIELETTNFAPAYEHFQALLKHYGIALHPSEKKIARAINALKK